MKEELPESITQREMDCIQSNLQQLDTKQFAANGCKEKETLFYEEKDKMLQNMQLSVVLQQPLGNVNTNFLI